MDAIEALLDQDTPGAAPPAAPPIETNALEGVPAEVATSASQGQADLALAALGGVAKAGFETKDTALELMGQTSEKSGLRQSMEEGIHALEAKSPINGLARGVTQFATGFIGLGKVLGPLKWGGKVYDAARGAVTGAVAFDPHEQRLSNLVEDFPFLQNAVTGFLAAKPEDSKALGRFKSAIENLILPIGVEVPLAGARYAARSLTSLVEAIKLRRLGDLPGANAAVADAETALARANKGLANDERGTVQDTGSGPGGGDGAPPAGQPTGVADAAPGGEALGGPDLHAPGDSPIEQLLSGSPEGRNRATAGPAPGAVGPEAGTLERVPSGETVRAAPKVTPKVTPKVEITPEQTQGLIEKAQKDTGALLDAGGYEAAVAEGHVFSQTDLIPWQKLASGNERVDAWMGRVVEEQSAFVDKTRGGNAEGVLTDKRVDRMVEARAAAFGEDPAALRGLILGAGDNARTMVANMETAYVLSQKGMQDTYSLAMRINAGNFGGFESEAAAKMGLKVRLQSTLEMFAAAKAMTAAAGRTMRRMRGEFRSNADALQKLNIDGANPDALTDLVLSTLGNPAAMAQLQRPGFWANLVDHAATLQAANLLWGWYSQTINIGMNVVALYGRPLLQELGGSILQVGGKLRGDDALMAAARSARMQARKETVTTHMFIGDAWNAAKWAFLNGDSRLAPHSANEFTAISLGSEGTSAATAQGGASRAGVRPVEEIVNGWRNVESVGDVVYNALYSAFDVGTLPLRAMGTADEAIKTMRYRAVVAAKADADAATQGLAIGSPEYKAYIESRVRSSFDERGGALDVDALTEARVTTYQQPLIGSGTEDTWGGWKSAGAAIQQGVNSIPPARFILPFIKTPTNLFRYGIKLTPGINLLQREYLNALTGAKGVQAQSMATGEMMLGILLASTAIGLKMNGRIVGGGPVDAKAAKAWKDDGHMPYSIVVPGKNGEKDQYIQFNRLDPVAAPLGLVADFADILMQGHLNEDQEHGIAMSLVLAFSHQLKSKTYLQNIAGVLDGITDDNKMQSLPQRLAPGFMPLSTLLQGVTQIEDPVMHEIHGVMDATKARMPGLSDSVPPHRDAFGGVVMNPGKFYSEQKNPTALARALDESYAATGGYLLPPSPRVVNGNIDLRDVTLESGRNAYDRYQELAGNPTGKLPIKDVLDRIVQSDAYKVMPHGKVSEDGSKQWALEKPMRENREAALGLLKAESPKFLKLSMQRTQQMYGQLATNVKDLRAAQAAGGASAVSELLKPFGLTMPTPAAQVPAATQQ